MGAGAGSPTTTGEPIDRVLFGALLFLESPSGPKERDYAIRINTANGAGRAAQVDLRMVEVGDIVVRDLSALIIRDNMLNVNLLGMRFLSRLRWSHERGKLMLEQ